MDTRQWLKMANLVFELDKKIVSREDNPALRRIYDKMKQTLEEAGVFLYNPAGEKYSETRTDVEANISGTSANNLFIKEVIKPVLYTEENGRRILIQKGVVIVEGT
jgi:hypothetical protein